MHSLVVSLISSVLVVSIAVICSCDQLCLHRDANIGIQIHLNIDA